MRTSHLSRERLPDQASLLLDCVERLSRHRAGRRAVHIRLSTLKAHNRREHHLRIAWNMFEGLVRTYEGHIFRLDNADIVFIYKGASVAAIDGAVLKLRYLFSEDPVLQAHDPLAPDRFCAWYDLEKNYDDLLTLAQQLVDEHRRRSQTPENAPVHAPAQAPALTPMMPDDLGRIVQIIARADLSNLIRRQAICAILPGAPPHPVFQELYISIRELQEVVAPTVNLAANRWLFQYLTETLDKRMLAAVPRVQDSTLSSRFSLNLNVGTLLSQEFLVFDDAIKSPVRGAIVIELQAADIFSDMGAYLFARDFVRDRGYRLCIDGLSYLTAPLLDRERLGFDLVKILWSPEMGDEVADRRMAYIRELVQTIGEARVILCRCESEEAVRVGQSMGVTLFQGYHVDRLLETSKRQVGSGRAAGTSQPGRSPT